MLKIYFGSILIWMIIIFSMIYVCKDSIKAKGWIDETKKNKHWLVVLFCISSIPIFRLLVASGLLFMTTTTKEEYQKVNKDE
jgi:hypothetical protein